MVEDAPLESEIILTSDRRRAVVCCLERAEGSLDRRELAARIAAGEAAGASVPDEHVRDVEVMLHHMHLPKLADVGAVDYDPDAGIVSRGPDFSAALALLERSRHAGDGDPRRGGDPS